MNDAKLQSTSIQVMSRMFSLLDTLASGQDAISLKYIAAQTGLHPSTAHRILNDLAAGRYVERAGPGTYRLGLRLLELGNLVRSRLDLRDISGKPMVELHRLVGLTVSLYERQEQESICLARTAQERSGIQLHRGTSRSALIETTAGRAMLIKDTPAQVYHLCQQGSHRAESVSLDVQQARQSGLLSGPDDLLMGQTCTATPLFNDAGQVVGALCISGAPSADLAGALQDTAARISAQMGWRQPEASA